MFFFSALCAAVAVPTLFLWRLYFVRIGELVPGTDGLLYQLVTTHAPVHGDARLDAAYRSHHRHHHHRKRVHSHNDYERHMPLYEALHYGAQSVEADVWLVGDELLVGHTEDQLRPDRTLSSMYLQPLMDLVKEANTTSRPGAGLSSGVFKFSHDGPLQLLIDIKSDGPATFAAVHAALAPLRDAGFLSTWTPGHMHPSPSLITVVASGNAPLESVQALGTPRAPRDVFFDAPLADLEADKLGVYTPAVAPLASANFKRTFQFAWLVPCLGRRRMREMVAAAHARGIEARFWSTPRGFLRSYAWKMQLEENVDWLNVDDLAAAARF